MTPRQDTTPQLIMKRKSLLFYVFLFVAVTLSQAGNFYFHTAKKKGETITIVCTYTGKLIVKGVYGDIVSGKASTLKVKETGGQISIQGAVTQLNLSNCALTAFGTSNNTEIQELWLTKNQLTKLNADSPKGCPNLSSVAIYANKFTKTGVYDIGRYLPDRRGKTPGQLHVYSEDMGDHNQFNSALVHILKYKNWQVISYRRGGPSNGVIEQDIYIQFTSGLKRGERMSIYMQYPPANQEDIYFYDNITGKAVNGLEYYKITGEGQSSITLDGVKELNLNPGSSTDQPIKEISEIQSPVLEELYFRRTGVTKIDLSKCPKLTRVGCYGNGMTADQLIAMIKTLPKVSSGTLDIYRSGIPNNNKWNNKVIQAANQRGWKVYALNNDNWEVLEAQDESAFHTITLKTDKQVGEKIDLWTTYEKDTSLELKGLEGTPVNGNWATYKLTSQEVSIRGAITEFSIVNDKVSSMELEENNTLRRLIFCNNLVSDGLDLSEQHALEEVRCEMNGIKGVSMDQFINFLPNRKGSAIVGKLRLSSVDDRDEGKNEYGPANIMAAAASGWYVTEYESSEQPHRIVHPGSISFTTNKKTGSTVNVFTQFYLPIELQGLEGTPKDGAWSELKLMSIKGTLTGSLYVLRISDSEVSDVDMHRNPVISTIIFDGNQLKTMDVTGCVALNSIDISNNQIVGKYMTAFMNSLPQIPSGQKARLTLSMVDRNAEGNKYTSEDLAIATQKGWTVVDQDYTPITEGNATGIESILAPNATDNTIYTLDGIRLFTPVDELPEGIYIIGGQKQIIRHIK